MTFFPSQKTFQILNHNRKMRGIFCFMVKLIDMGSKKIAYSTVRHFWSWKQAVNIELHLRGWNTSAPVKFHIKQIHKPIRIIISIWFQFESVFPCTKPCLAVWTNIQRWRVSMIQPCAKHLFRQPGMFELFHGKNLGGLSLKKFN